MKYFISCCFPDLAGHPRLPAIREVVGVVLMTERVRCTRGGPWRKVIPVFDEFGNSLSSYGKTAGCCLGQRMACSGYLLLQQLQLSGVVISVNRGLWRGTYLWLISLRELKIQIPEQSTLALHVGIVIFFQIYTDVCVWA